MTNSNRQSKDYQDLYWRAGEVFTPRSPVQERDLFAGRLDQVARVFDAIVGVGQHAVIFGERGVGKTSLGKMLAHLFPGPSEWFFVNVVCSSGDDYGKLWIRALEEIKITLKKQLLSNPLSRVSVCF